MEALVEVEAPVKFNQIRRNQEELVIALRSGRYSQCKWHHKEGLNRCFIGLGFELFSIDLEDHPIQLLANKLGTVDGRYFSMSDLNNNIVYKGINGLAMHNDRGKTFPEIASILVRDYNFPDVQYESKHSFV